MKLETDWQTSFIKFYGGLNLLSWLVAYHLPVTSKRKSGHPLSDCLSWCIMGRVAPMQVTCLYMYYFWSYSRTRCPFTQAMSLPSVVGTTKIDLEKSAKMWYFLFKISAISQNLEQLGRNFALHSGTTHGMCLHTIMGISVKMRALDPGQRFEHTFWILLLLQWRRRLQRYQKHIGPTLLT